MQLHYVGLFAEIPVNSILQVENMYSDLHFQSASCNAACMVMLQNSDARIT